MQIFHYAVFFFPRASCLFSEVSDVIWVGKLWRAQDTPPPAYLPVPTTSRCLIVLKAFWWHSARILLHSGVWTAPQPSFKKPCSKCINSVYIVGGFFFLHNWKRKYNLNCLFYVFLIWDTYKTVSVCSSTGIFYFFPPKSKTPFLFFFFLYCLIVVQEFYKMTDSLPKII